MAWVKIIGVLEPGDQWTPAHITALYNYVSRIARGLGTEVIPERKTSERVASRDGGQ
jgi:hypothetical protein